MKALNFVATSLPNESPTSLLNRTAYANGHKNFRRFRTHYLGYSALVRECFIPDFQTVNFLKEESASYADKTVVAFYPRTYEATKHAPLIVHGIRVPQKLLRLEYAAICPICLQEGWERYIKDIRLADYCPYHWVEYMTACPNCRKPFVWYRQEESKCACGFDMRRLQPTPLNQPPLETQLLDIFKAGDQQRFNRLLESLIAVGHDRTKGQLPHNRKLLEAGFAILNGNVEGIVSYLNYLSRRHPQINPHLIAASLPIQEQEGLTKAVSIFLNAPPSCAECTINEDFTLLTNQVKKYLGISTRQWLRIVHHLPINRHQTTNNRYNLSEIDCIASFLQQTTTCSLNYTPASYTTLKKAAIRLGAHYEACRRTVRAGLLEGKKTRAGILIPLSSIEAFERKYIFSTKIYKILNKSAQPVLKKIRESLIAPVSSAEIDGNFIPIFPLAEIQELISTPGFLESLNPSRKPTKKTFVSHLPRARKISTTNYSNTKETSNLLHIHPDLARQLIRTGLLGQAFGGRGNSVLVENKKIESFHRDYVFTEELSKELHYPRRYLGPALQALGISAASGPLVDGEHVVIYRRSDLPSDLDTRLENQPYRFYRYPTRSRPTHLTIKQVTQRLGLSRREVSRLTLNKTLTLAKSAPGLRPPQPGISIVSVERFERLVKTLVPLNDAIQSLQISAHHFARRFVASKFLEIITYKHAKYISQHDLNRAIEHMHNFCNYGDSDRLVGAAKGFTRYCVISGKLRNPPAERANGVKTVKLIAKMDILALRPTLPWLVNDKKSENGSEVNSIKTSIKAV
ncbi:hypothetical protein [Pseudomonas sp. TCU-HL1]|uniref:hypothetical protein n=1 Tax=Pseudomonas sp. TCU-HL1 TaxID=1856685 RepID=UPI00085904A8|nr:hypothetical protein [Pseudomonas sp. TCU-HL1]AOE86750.1 hypothetical protein THL1_4202 [Pseudomonas sp. TCU-HL1]